MLTPTQPIENIVPHDEYARDYMAFSMSLVRPRHLVDLHKERLGRQTTTMQGSDCRLWVWARPTWTVFVGNAKGICFEVPVHATPEQAWQAWADYKKALR